ncbi:MAG TPA: YncE family protein [Caldithrix abyssi]|uniref:YncE family protein n=1 Tax=Caldithrix abyssi TaxID=187145 RepID=A0A7V4U2G6_CALAY|nr:YncE family protein [Caldithrix abyssi]
MKTKLLITALVLFLMTLGCVKDPTGTEDSEKTPKLTGAFILNQGNFTAANASLSFYDPEADSLQNDIFKSINLRSLGDVAQSMTIIDSLGYIVVNNSHKIEVISLNTWKSKATINLPAGSSPRYLVPAGDGTAFVTNLYTASVAVIDLQSNQIEQSITVGDNPEELAVVNGKAYVANSGFGWNNTVSVIDVATRKVVKTITVGDYPLSVRVDAENDVHVLCSGRWPAWNDTTDKGTDGALFVIDSGSDAVVDSFVIKGHPTQLSLDGNKTGYFLNGQHVVKYSTETNEVTDPAFISGYFYGLEVDPLSKDIYLLDAKDYVQNGELFIYDAQGAQKINHTVGIIPGSVTFVYENVN